MTRNTDMYLLVTYTLHDQKYVDTWTSPKSWALIWNWSHLCCYNSLHSSGKDFHYMLENWWRDLLPCSHERVSEAGHWCWVFRPCSLSGFLFIPKVFDGREVRALCRPVKFFHTKLDKPFLYGQRFIHGGIVMLKQERAFHNLLPQSWKHRIV